MIAEQLIDFAHLGKHSGINLNRAARNDDAGVRIIALGFADLAAAFRDSVICDGAGVDDHCALLACVPRILSDNVRLIGV